MRLVFLGTPDFAVPALRALAGAGHDIAAVLSRPDRPSGRGQKVHQTPVKQAAGALGLLVWEPEDVNSPEVLADLRQMQPDLLVVVAYGQFLGDELLAIPRYGAVNIHASLLPAYRGAAPIHRAVLNGDAESGVTIMHIDSGMDSGDIILQASAAIGPDMTTGELHDVLAVQGAELLLTAVRQISEGSAPRIRQDHRQATRAPLLKRGEEAVAWAEPAGRVHNRIRGLSPWPGAYAIWRGKRLKLLRSTEETVSPEQAAVPGTVLRADQQGLLVACGSGAVLVSQVQPEGKAAMSGGDLVRGYHLQAGEQLA